MTEALLEVESLTVHHGQLCAIDNVSFTQRQGEVLAMIGANGAGKSTLLRTIAGLHRPTSGCVRLDGKDINDLSVNRRVALGISLVPEGRRLFSSMTLQENLQVGAYHANPGPFDIKRIYELFDWMPSRRKQSVWQLSGGEQQMLALASLLSRSPRITIVDEISHGLAPAIVVTAECDLLRDEAEHYAMRLRQAGIPVRLWRFSGQIHGFLSLGAALPEVREAKQAITSLVGAVLANPAALSNATVGTPPGVIEL